LVRAGSIEELTAGSDTVLVRSPNPEPLLAAVSGDGTTVQRPDANTLQIHGMSLDQVGHAAFTAGVELHELSAQRFDLEELFFALTSDAEGADEPARPS
jgi:ABC-2 type transport system ATP-binding protein